MGGYFVLNIFWGVKFEMFGAINEHLPNTAIDI
jgi:hypothetical protein